MGVRCIELVATFQSMDFSDNLCEISFKTIMNREVWKDGWMSPLKHVGNQSLDMYQWMSILIGTFRLSMAGRILIQKFFVCMIKLRHIFLHVILKGLWWVAVQDGNWWTSLQDCEHMRRNRKKSTGGWYPPPIFVLVLHYCSGWNSTEIISCLFWTKKLPVWMDVDF